MKQQLESTAAKDILLRTPYFVLLYYDRITVKPIAALQRQCSAADASP